MALLLVGFAATTAVQAQRLLFKKRIARVAIDHVMKLLVLAVIAIGVVGYDRFGAPCIRGVEISESRFGDAMRGKASADALDFGHGFKHFHQFDQTRLSDEYAPARDLFGEAGGDKPSQGLTDGGA